MWRRSAAEASDVNRRSEWREVKGEGALGEVVEEHLLALTLLLHPLALPLRLDVQRAVAVVVVLKRRDEVVLGDDALDRSGGVVIDGVRLGQPGGHLAHQDERDRVDEERVQN